MTRQPAKFNCSTVRIIVPTHAMYVESDDSDYRRQRAAGHEPLVKRDGEHFLQMESVVSTNECAATTDVFHFPAHRSPKASDSQGPTNIRSLVGTSFRNLIIVPEPSRILSPPDAPPLATSPSLMFPSAASCSSGSCKPSPPFERFPEESAHPLSQSRLAGSAKRIPPKNNGAGMSVSCIHTVQDLR
jgi:hypothetical protein